MMMMIAHFGVICLSFCKYSADSYAKCMKSVPNDITFTGQSRYQPSMLSAFLTGFALISRVAYIWRGLWGATPMRLLMLKKVKNWSYDPDADRHQNLIISRGSHSLLANACRV